MPQTVIGGPSGGGSRRKIFSSHIRSCERSKTIRCPDSAPQRSVYPRVWAVDDPLQVRLQQQLRAGLMVLVEALHPVLRVLAEERLERLDQPPHVQTTVLIHVPRRLDDPSYPLLTQLERQLVDMRFPTQDKSLLGFQDVVLDARWMR